MILSLIERSDIDNAIVKKGYDPADFTFEESRPIQQSGTTYSPVAGVVLATRLSNGKSKRYEATGYLSRISVEIVIDIERNVFA